MALFARESVWDGRGSHNSSQMAGQAGDQEDRRAWEVAAWAGERQVARDWQPACAIFAYVVLPGHLPRVEEPAAVGRQVPGERADQSSATFSS